MVDIKISSSEPARIRHGETPEYRQQMDDFYAFCERAAEKCGLIFARSIQTPLRGQLEDLCEEPGARKVKFDTRQSSEGPSYFIDIETEKCSVARLEVKPHQNKPLKSFDGIERVVLVIYGEPEQDSIELSRIFQQACFEKPYNITILKEILEKK